jgi:hypothetical protein
MGIIGCGKKFSMENDVPKKRYPVIDKDKKSGLEEIQWYDNNVEDILTGNKDGNREGELSKVCNKCFSNIILRFVRQLLNMDVQSFLQFKSLTKKNVKDKTGLTVAIVYLMNLLKFGIQDLKRLKENYADLENIYKKRRIKISSMEDDVSISRYPDKDQIEFEEVMNFVHAEDGNTIKYSKVYGNVKINSPKSVVHKKWGLLQFNDSDPRWWELLLNNIEMSFDLTSFFSLKFGKISMQETKYCNDWIPGWMARAKFLKRSKEKFDERKFEKRKKFAEDRFVRKWKFKNLRKIEAKSKFKMKDLLHMAQESLDPTSSEGINEEFSTAAEEQ